MLVVFVLLFPFFLSLFFLNLGLQYENTRLALFLTSII